MGAEIAVVIPSPAEVAASLGEQEQIIERGLQTFIEVGTALKKIRDSRLYRGKYRTFEDYCKERWGMTRRRAYQLLDGSDVVANVNSCSHAPTNEAQVRPLVGLPVEDQRRVWAAAVKRSHGKPTARVVKDAVYVAIHSRREEKHTDPKPFGTPARGDLPREKPVRYGKRLTKRGNDTNQALYNTAEELRNIVVAAAELEIGDVKPDDLRTYAESFRKTRTMLSKIIKALEAS